MTVNGRKYENLPGTRGTPDRRAKVGYNVSGPAAAGAGQDQPVSDNMGAPLHTTPSTSTLPDQMSGVSTTLITPISGQKLCK